MHNILLVCATGQDFHWKLPPLYADIQSAKNTSAGGGTVTKATGPKEKDSYLSNILIIQLDKYTDFVKNDYSGICAQKHKHLKCLWGNINQILSD